MFWSWLLSRPPAAGRALRLLSALLVVVCGVPAAVSVTRELAIPRHPVAGQILVDGQPQRGVELVIYRPSARDSFVPLATAWSRADGRFVVRTLGVGAGVPVGEYVVTARWCPPAVDGEALSTGPNRLACEYADPALTPVRLVVGPGENLLPPWNVHPCRCRRPADPLACR